MRLLSAQALSGGRWLATDHMVQGMSGPDRSNISRQVFVAFLQPNEDKEMEPCCGVVDGGATLGVPAMSEPTREQRMAELAKKGSTFGAWVKGTVKKADTGKVV